MLSFPGKLSFFGLAAVLLGACATQPPPITKLVGGRQVTTRAVDPTAYVELTRFGGRFRYAAFLAAFFAECSSYVN